MPNPFRKKGSAFHSPDRWVAFSFGLTAQVLAAAAEGVRTIAVVGHVGSGKTVALDAYRQKVETAGGDVLALKLNELMPDGKPDLLDVVYQAFIGHYGTDAWDRAVKSANLPRMPTPGPASASDHLRIMGHMIKNAAAASPAKRLHLVMDEALTPLEALIAENERATLVKFYARLQSLAELLDETGGAMILSTSPDSWGERATRTGVPKTTQDRFALISAAPLSAEQIHTFLLEGLKHTRGDAPMRASSDLAELISKRYEELDTVRQLHELLHAVWHEAFRQGAHELNGSHLPERAHTS
jgi:hypothetical protein